MTDTEYSDGMKAVIAPVCLGRIASLSGEVTCHSSSIRRDKSCCNTLKKRDVGNRDRSPSR